MTELESLQEQVQRLVERAKKAEAASANSHEQWMKMDKAWREEMHAHNLTKDERDAALDVCRKIVRFAEISIRYIETTDNQTRELVAQIETIKRFAEMPLDD